MTTSNQINPGMILSITGKLFRVESSVRVTVPKGTPFIKTKLRDMGNGKVVEKNFKLNQTVTDIAMTERRLEFLYLEGKNFLFIDIGNLEQILVPPDIVGKKAHYLKEGVELKGFLHGETVFSVELPQFLELMVTKTESEAVKGAAAVRMAILETGAKVEVPQFIEAGDIIKIDTKTDEYIQRV